MNDAAGHKVMIVLLSLFSSDLSSKKKGYKRLQKNGNPITLYNSFNPVAINSRKCFTKEISRIVTGIPMFHVKHDTSGIISSDYLPRRGRIQEGEAIAVYFAMCMTSVLGAIRSQRGEGQMYTLLPLGAGITEPNCRTFGVSCRLRCPLSLRQLPRQGSRDAKDNFAGVMFHVKRKGSEKCWQRRTNFIAPHIFM